MEITKIHLLNKCSEVKVEKWIQNSNLGIIVRNHLMSSNSRRMQPIESFFFVHHTINVVLEGNAKKLHKTHKNLGEITKVFKGFRIPKKGGHKHFLKKAQRNH